MEAARSRLGFEGGGRSAAKASLTINALASHSEYCLGFPKWAYNHTESLPRKARNMPKKKNPPGTPRAWPRRNYSSQPATGSEMRELFEAGFAELQAAKKPGPPVEPMPPELLRVDVAAWLRATRGDGERIAERA